MHPSVELICEAVAGKFVSTDLLAVLHTSLRCSASHATLHYIFIAPLSTQVYYTQMGN